MELTINKYIKIYRIINKILLASIILIFAEFLIIILVIKYYDAVVEMLAGLIIVFIAFTIAIVLLALACRTNAMPKLNLYKKLLLTSVLTFVIVLELITLSLANSSTFYSSNLSDVIKGNSSPAPSATVVYL